jgi:integrase
MKRTKPVEVKEGNVSVKIYRRSRTVRGATYTVHEIADYTTGRRVLRSFSDPEKATKEAEKIARLLSAGESTAAQLRNADAASYGRAIELLRDTGVALEIAAGHFADAFKLLGSDRIVEAAKFFVERNPDNLTRRTVAEVVKELLDAKEARSASNRYIQDLRARLNRFAESFAVEISTVTTADVQRWFDGLKLSKQTVKNFRTVLGTLFKFAESRGHIFKGSNPITSTERVKAKNGDAVEIFTASEITKLLASADDDFRPCLALGAFAGLRSAEIERIEWSDIDLKGGHIHVAADKAKTASRRLVPIVPNLKEWLLPMAKRKGLVWKETHEDFYAAMQATAEASGVAWKQNGLRHSFISYRLAQIQNAAQVSLEAGNSAQVVFSHYREVVKAKDAKKWFAVRPKKSAKVVTLEVASA